MVATMDLSVVTINYNNKSGLIRTLESIAIQDFKQFELIVIDGGSTDGSIDIIKQYEHKIAHWISEPDKGIYNAQNKGVALASGTYINFLNSGDWYISEDVLSRVFSSNHQGDILYGSPILYYSEDRKIPSIHPPSVDFLLFFRQSINHQASFIKRQLLIENPMNEAYKLASDWEFFIKSFFHGRTFEHLDQLICYYEMGGFSTADKNKPIHEIERKMVLDSFMPQWMQADYEFLWMAKKTKTGDFLQKLSQIPRADRIISFFCRTLMKLYSIKGH